MGMWVPVHDDEWDGDVPLDLAKRRTSNSDMENGKTMFKSETLPWQVGTYEVRRHLYLTTSSAY